MAIYNPRRARELEAAARAAEAQRETEARRGQREAQTWQQVLGTVDQLIGLAPQAIGAYETGEAQKVLAGERPLEREKPKDVLEGIAQFISSPFESGVQRRAKAMAGEMAPAELAKLQPLTTQAVQQRLAEGVQPLDTREARKQISPEEFEKRLGKAMPVEAAARGVLERSPALRLLPEREREAMAVGEAQRVQAEQAAAASAAELRQAQLDKLRADAEAKQAAARKETGGVSATRKDLVEAAKGAAFESIASLEKEMNVVGDPDMTGQTISKVRSLAEEAYVARGGDPETNEGQADVNKIVEDAYKKYQKKPFSVKDYDVVQIGVELDSELRELDSLRKKVKFKPTDAQQIRQAIADTEAPFNLDAILKTANDLMLRGEITNDQLVYLRLAAQAKNNMIKAANGGYNVTNSDFTRLTQIVLDPMAPQEVWDGLLTGTLRNANKSAKERFDLISSTVTAPAALAKQVAALELPEIKLSGSQEKSLARSASDAGRVFQDLASYAANVGISALGLDQIIEAGLKSDDSSFRSLAESADAMRQMLLGKSAAPAPAAPAAPTSAAAPAPARQRAQVPSGDIAPELAYRQLKDAGQLEGRRIMLIVTLSNGKTKYYPVADTPAAIESLTAKLKERDPGVKTEAYAGNDAGGM